MNKKETLEMALQSRIAEIADYQLNIDNYRLAIPIAEADPDLKEFTERLKELLRTSLLEQKKSQVMLDVIKSQLE